MSPSVDPVSPTELTWGVPGDPRVSLVGDQVELRTAAQMVCAEAGLSFVLDPSVDGTTLVDCNFERASVETAMKTLAGWAGAAAVYDVDTVWIVPRDAVGQGVRFIRPGYELPENIVGLLDEFVGDGNVSVVGDRLAVTGDADALERAGTFEKLLARGPDAWRVDLRVVSISDQFRRTLGLDWNLSFFGQLDFESGAFLAADALTGDGATAFVRLVGDAVESGEGATLLNDATLYVLEGSRVEFQQGGRVAIPLRRTSDQGTVTTTGVEYVKTGFTVDVQATRVPKGVRLDLEPEISEVSGFVEEFPTLTTSKLVSSVVLQSGEWVVLSGLETERGRLSESGLPFLSRVPGVSRRSRQAESSRLLLLVRAVRVYASGDRS